MKIGRFERKETAYGLSKVGQARLAQLHPLLAQIVNEVLHYRDITITCSYRSRAEQDAAYVKGNSKAKFGQSAHNFLPSRAVDIIPYPIPMKNGGWDNNSKEWDELAQLFLEIAKQKNILITWGGNWKSLVDKPHFELTNWKNM